MSIGLKADANNTSGAIQIGGIDKVIVTNAGDVAATTFTGNLVGNADTATKLSTSTGTAPVYGIRAWIAFDGTRDSTGATNTNNTARFIYASGNITSVVLLAGNQVSYDGYNAQVTFTIPMPDANYAVVSSSSNISCTNCSPALDPFWINSRNDYYSPGWSSAVTVPPTVNGFLIQGGFKNHPYNYLMVVR